MAYLWMKINLLVSLGWSSIILTGCQSIPPPPLKTLVTVDRAISGNTIELSNKQRVRLVGIDAPSWEQKPWGTAAKDRLEAIVQQQNHQFWLELEANDLKNGRQYGYLWQKNNALVNEQLIREGHALAFTTYVNPQYEQQLVRAQSYARLMGVGIWNHESPMRNSPSEFKTRN